MLPPVWNALPTLLFFAWPPLTCLLKVNLQTTFFRETSLALVLTLPPFSLCSWSLSAHTALTVTPILFITPSPLQNIEYFDETSIQTKLF